MSTAKELQTNSKSLQVSELNAFEITIQEHEKELDFVPDMETEESRKKSAEVLKSARKTYNAIDSVRLELKKEAEKLANAIHEQGKAALTRLEVKYNPHKEALDAYKAEQKEKEEALKQAFANLCEWLRDIVGQSQFASTDEIKAFIAEVESKDQDNTGQPLTDNQKFEYAKFRMSAQEKLSMSLQQRIILDAEEERQRVAAIQLAEEQEKLRAQQEEFERQQQEMRVQKAAIEAKEKAEAEAKERTLNAEREAAAAKQREAEAEERAKQAAIEAEARAVQAAKDAEANAKLLAEQAREDEIARQKAAQEAEAAELEIREANKKHVGKIRKEAKESLMKLGISEDHAKKAVLAIHAGEISHVSISY